MHLILPSSSCDVMSWACLHVRPYLSRALGLRCAARGCHGKRPLHSWFLLHWSLHILAKVDPPPHLLPPLARLSGSAQEPQHMLPIWGPCDKAQILYGTSQLEPISYT